MARNFNDPLFYEQWHYRRDMDSLQRVWADYNGTGVRTGVIDDYVDISHVDLKGVVEGGFPFRSDIPFGAWHGTAVAALVAGTADNGAGGVGLSWGSKIVPVTLPASQKSPAALAAAVGAANKFDTAVINAPVTAKFADLDPLQGQALAHALFNLGEGRQGLGTILVNGAGDQWASESRDANASALSQARQTVTVASYDRGGAIDANSNHGASVLLAAPGAGLYVADPTGNFGFGAGDSRLASGDTGLAAAGVTGAVNLMLDANDKLGARDVQAILAITADHDLVTAPGNVQSYVVNKAGNVDGGGLEFRNETGFGRLDAYEAVRFAEVWSNFDDSREMRIQDDARPKTFFNEAVATGSPTTATSASLKDFGVARSAFSVSGDITVQHVDVELKLSHGNVNDLLVELISPSGTRSVLLEPGKGQAATKSNWTWTLGSEAFLGESAKGEWKVAVTDTRTGATGSVDGVGLKVYGDRAGENDVYHYTNDFLSRPASAATPYSTAGNGRATLVDADGGYDWINMAGIKGNVSADLEVGRVSVDDQSWFRIAAGSRIEAIVTGDGNDVLRGNAADNELKGMRGDDRIYGDKGRDLIDGGAGNDLVDYSMSDAAVFVDVSNTPSSQGARGGFAEGDHLIGIENVVGSRFDDYLGGSDEANVLVGGAGNDMLWGGRGADTLDGGAGIDTASYEGHDGVVVVSLGTKIPVLANGWGYQPTTGDRLVDIENLQGSHHNDVLIGNEKANHLRGELGNDLLYGMDGDDVLSGSVGADRLDGGAGIDTASYEWDMEGVGVKVDLSLSTAQVSKGTAAGDVLVGIERVVGTRYDDVLTGASFAETLEGGGGNDVVFGSAGADRLIGGDGVDTLNFSKSTAGVSVFFESTSAGHGGFAQGDTFSGFENLVGSAYGDVLFGDRSANRIEGGAGHDSLNGMLGNDVLIGGAGNDSLTGGAGADTFVFAQKGFGADNVTDFVNGTDKIDLRGMGLTYASVSVKATTAGDMLTFAGHTDSILLLNHKGGVAAGDFLFA